MAQIPRGHEHLVCPFHKVTMDQVCHKCPLWVQLRGVDPQTGEVVADEWQCTFTFLPKLLIENSQQSRQAGASADKVATETAKVGAEIRNFHENMAKANMITIQMLEANADERLMISNGKDIS